MASAPSSSSLARHLESLYPLACVLVGPDRADSLVERAYEQAADVPPAQRPSDERAWLFRLLLSARDEDTDVTAPPASPETSSSAGDDSFRRAVAVQTARQHLPVALAACSARQRFVLTLDVLDADVYTVAAALDRTPDEARSARDEARSALRASLRDVLNGPERMLVDVALPDEALRPLLHSLLEDEFLPLPSPLETRIQARVEALSAPDEETDSASDEDTWAALQRRLNTRPSILVGLVLVFVAGGLAGLAYFDTPAPSPAPSQNVIELSAERASELSVTQNLESPDEAEAFVLQTWDRRVSIPTIDGAPLEGTGRLSLDDGAEVPALFYRDDETGTQLVAYVFNYAVLDRLGDRVRLGTALRQELAANEAPLTRRRGNRALVLWRQRDDIFVLVGPDVRPDALQSRLQLGSAGAN